MSTPSRLGGRRFLRAASALLSIAATAIAISAASGPASKATSAVPGDAAAGKKIFMVKCVPCHKADGSGGIKLTGNPTPNWRDPKRMADPRFGDAYLRDCMTNGKIKSGMQPITKIGVKLDDIPNLIAHIRTLSQAKK